jgi:phosphatidylinositol alpha-1,6-mannosyltransferase
LSRRSILVVTRNYPPLTGGMERLMQHSVETLASEFDVTLIGPQGCGEFSPANIQTIECPASPLSFLTSALLEGRRAARRNSFDVVLGGSGLVSPVTCLLASKAKARSVIFVHGLDLVVDNWIYQHVFVPFLRRHDRVIANSQNTRALAIDKGCPANRVEIVNPGSTIPPDSLLRQADAVREKLGLTANKVVLSVGRMVPRKGLAEFLENAWPLIIDAQPDAILLVVGDTPDDALLKDSKGTKRLMNAIERCGKGTVRFLGVVDDDTLWNCYAAADTLVFPLIRVQGDVEGFGMVAIEAAASGTPTVAFPVGGVVDAVADGISGSLVPEGDYRSFADAVVQICKGGPPSSSACRNYAQNFSWDKHAERLLAALNFSADIASN